MKNYLNQWQLENALKIASTHTSDIYQVSNQDGETLVLKHLNETGRADEAGGGAILKWYNGDGAVHLINADQGAHLLEFAAGEELAELVQSDEDIRATQIICQVVNKLHSARDKAPPKSLIPLKEWFKDLYQEASTTKDPLIKNAASIAGEMFASTTNAIPLHGDLHHHNIMNSPRGWLAIDPKGLIGDPCYDLANFFGNPENMQDLWVSATRIEMMLDMFCNELGYPRERLIKFAFIHNVISTIWSGCSAVDRSGRYEVARKLYDLI